MSLAAVLAEPARAEDEVITLDSMAIRARADRVKLYSNTIDKTWDQAMEARTICYLDILQAAYPKVNIPQVLLRKKDYREKYGQNFDWFCNYGATTRDIKVRFDVTDFREGRSRSWGGLDWKRRIITISDEARSELLFHFAGIALSSYPSNNTLERVKALGRAKKTRVFVDATFLESQLQELNRLFFTLTGRIIFTPIDSVEALALCGATLDREKIITIFNRHNIKYKPAELDRALTVASQKDFSGYFRYAAALAQGATSTREWIGVDENGNSTYNREEYNELKGLADYTGKRYDDLLEQILITAPGHL